MNLQELRDSWSVLRNAVMGRGATKPANVSQLLYDSTAESYAEWRAFLEQNYGILETYGVAEIVDAPAFTWVNRYRELAGWARAEGLSLGDELPGGLTESARDLGAKEIQLAKDLAKAAGDAAKEARGKLEMFVAAVGVGVGVIVAIWAVGRR